MIVLVMEMSSGHAYIRMYALRGVACRVRVTPAARRGAHVARMARLQLRQSFLCTLLFDVTWGKHALPGCFFAMLARLWRAPS